MADWQTATRKAAEKYGLDPDVFERQIRQESSFNPNAVSGAGAIGIAQIMPATAAGWGVNPHDPAASLDAAAKHMAQYVKQYGSYRDALVAYNAGPGKVGQALPAETQDYIRTILGGSNPKVSTTAASSTSQSGSTTSAGGVSSTAPSAPDPGGQSSDFTGLLASLLAGNQGQQQAQPLPLAPPGFASSALTPQGFHPLGATATSQAPGQDALSANLSLVQALQGPGAAGTSPGTTTGAQTAPSASTGIAARVQQQRAAGIRISPHAKAGDPVVSSMQSVGGEHATEGLAGYPAHDYFAPAGSHAVAPVSGKVVRLSGHDPMLGPTQGPHGPLGYSVYIQGDDGKTYYLTHMGARTVKAGQTVQQGQIIGTVADYDKYGTPSHIHMGISG